MLVVGIDATNLRRGGGRTHLIEVLRAARPSEYGIGKVVVWGARDTLDLIEDRDWLVKDNPMSLEGNFFSRTFWQRFKLSQLARTVGCDILFVPGGSYSGDFQPTVTMNRNMLPFEWRELRRFGWSLTTLRLILLRLIQSRTLRSVVGIIFLTQYAKSAVEQVTGALPNTAIIPHGINSHFMMPPREQKSIETYSAEHPFRILYVSIINHYKHQWHVVEGIARLRKITGWNLALDLVGPSSKGALSLLQASIQRHDPEKTWVRYHGSVPYSEINTIYKSAHLGVFASSCETFGQILMEKMSAGLPVVCSGVSAMPELLGDAGVYFDPEDPQDISNALQRMIAYPELRAALSNASFEVSKQYTWERCADATFAFLVDVHRKFSQ